MTLVWPVALPVLRRGGAGLVRLQQFQLLGEVFLGLFGGSFLRGLAAALGFGGGLQFGLGIGIGL